MKTLLVFDFDHTVIDDNSDTWVIKCTPKQDLPDWLKNTYQKGHWTEYMGRVLSYIGDQGIREDAIRTVMETMPYTAGMIDLLKFIGQNKERVDCIIISDSNTVFIDWILHAAGAQCAVDRVFTNPAHFDDRGYLDVQCFHSHSCAQCPVNLCKRKVLEDFLERQLMAGLQYQQTVYIGDGGNDLCPVKSLKKSDVAMPRKGYSLERLISKLNAGDSRHLESRVVGWSSGLDILNEMNSLMKQSCL